MSIQRQAITTLVVTTVIGYLLFGFAGGAGGFAVGLLIIGISIWWANAAWRDKAD